MKMKFGTLVVAFCLAVLGCTLVGCSQQSPTDVTKAFLSAAQTQNQEQLAKTYSGSNLPMNDSSELLPGSLSDGTESSDGSEDEYTEEQTEILQALVDKAFAFDYEVLGESIEDDTAKVEVKFTTYEIGDAISDALSEYLSKAFLLALSGADEQKIMDIFFDALDEEIQGLEEKKFDETVKLSLTKTDDGWKVDELGEDQLDAMFGGLYSCLNSISSK